MKDWINKKHNDRVNKFYQVKFSCSLVKDFTDKAKMEEWIINTKKKYSLNYEPEIKVFKKIGETTTNNTKELWDVYEEE